MLSSFLAKKPLFYDKIDYDRMPRIYAKIKKYLPKTPMIHIIGTNGKGTTGRFLATALFNGGYKTLHYTSPHISKFNERIWIDGKNISDEMLEDAHKKLQLILSKDESDSLSYFEYSTFLAFLLSSGCDFAVFEAGLGGERDATCVFEKKLTLLSSVDIDHESFLGSTIEEIATTKLKAMQKDIVIGEQRFSQVLDIAHKTATQLGTNVYTYKQLLDSEDMDKILKISDMLELPLYLQQNLKLAISGLKFLDIEYGMKSFDGARLFGRLSKIGENIVIDVGHNPLAATSVLKALSGKKYILVYNSYKDKDYNKIISILKPIIKHVEIIDIEDERVVKKELLQTSLNSLGVKYSTFTKIDNRYDYLVFGSFSVVEQFLKVFHG